MAKTQETTNIHDRPISIPKSTMDWLLKQKEIPPYQAIAVYLFLYYTTVWQKNNRAWATVKYISKGVGFGERAVRKVKVCLEKWGLIKSITTRDEGQKITGHYLEVYFFSETTLANFHRVEKCKEKYLNSNNESAAAKAAAAQSSSSLINEEKPTTWESRCAIKLESALNKHGKVHHRVLPHSWQREFVLLANTSPLTRKQISKVLTWFCKQIGKPFMPTVHHARTFRQKFPNILEMCENAMIKQGRSRISKKDILKVSHRDGTRVIMEYDE